MLPAERWACVSARSTTTNTHKMECLIIKKTTFRMKYHTKRKWYKKKLVERMFQWCFRAYVLFSVDLSIAQTSLASFFIIIGSSLIVLHANGNAEKTQAVVIRQQKKKRLRKREIDVIGTDHNTVLIHGKVIISCVVFRVLCFHFSQNQRCASRDTIDRISLDWYTDKKSFSVFRSEEMENIDTTILFEHGERTGAIECKEKYVD